MVATKLAKDMSIEHAVNQLIQEATDFDHLATIFSGQSTVLCSRPFDDADLRYCFEQKGWQAFL